jgi:hypothetical protein
MSFWRSHISLPFITTYVSMLQFMHLLSWIAPSLPLREGEADSNNEINNSTHQIFKFSKKKYKHQLLPK